MAGPDPGRCSVLVRRNAYERVGGFDPTLVHAADWEMWTRLAAFGPVAIVRPTSTKLGGAQAAVMSFVNDGLFRGQKPLNNPELVRVLLQLAEEADEARRGL